MCYTVTRFTIFESLVAINDCGKYNYHRYLCESDQVYQLDLGTNCRELHPEQIALDMCSLEFKVGAGVVLLTRKGREVSSLS